MLSSKRLTIYLLSQLIILFGLGYYLYKLNQPVAITKPSSDKFQCVSYAPYYQQGQTPLKPETTITRQQIESDLKKLADITHCVRTYSVNQGLDYVPAAAKQAGLTVYLGAWIGWTEEDNFKEIDLATKVANAYPDTVKGIIIGNEVLLRQEQSEVTLTRYLQRAKQQTPTPLTYADVWEFWLKHPALEKDVDFITVHVLPYWEDNPINVTNGATHAKNVMSKLKQTFHKPLLIGETGWPSAGRQRNTSSPGNVNQARYIREFMTVAETEGWRYNIIEAIDQPWKRILEGTVGAFWGVYDAKLQAKFNLKSPVAERHDGGLPIIAAMLGAILFFSLSSKHQHTPLAIRMSNSILGASTGIMALLQWQYLTNANQNWLESLPLLLVIVTGWLSLLALVKHLSNASKTTQDWLHWTTLALLLFSMIANYLLFHDGRYRNFPTALFLLPSLVLPLYHWLTNKPLALSKWRLLLICVAAIYAVLVVSSEVDNLAAIVWAGIVALLALANWPRTEYKHTNNNT